LVNFVLVFPVGRVSCTPLVRLLTFCFEVPVLGTVVPSSFLTKASFVCWKVVFFWKVNSRKVNYFLMFGSVMKNKLENTFQCFVMSWKMSWKITY